MQLVQRDAHPTGLTHQVAHQSARVSGALRGAPVGVDVAHVGPGALAHLDKSFCFEVSIRLHHRGGVHAQPRGELAHRRQRVARSQLGRGNRDAHPGGDLFIERCWAAGIDLIEHGASIPTVSLLWYSVTIIDCCQWRAYINVGKRDSFTPMRVLVSGASGLIGSSLVPLLQRAGHEVIRLVRPPAPGGPGAVPWDPAAGWIEVSKLEGIDGVVHLSGETILGRWTAEKKKRVQESRVSSTRLLAESLAGLNARPRVLVCASGTGYYGDRADELLTEDSTQGTGFLAELCREWETAAAPAAAAGIRTVHIRTGPVVAPNGGLLGPMLLPFQLGLGGPLANGRAWWSWIAIDDVAQIYRFALERDDVRGAVNAVAPAAVTNGDFARALGKILGRPAGLPVPRFALRMLFGEEAVREAMLSSARVAPARLQAAGFRFAYPELETALRHMVGQSEREVRSDGTT